MNLDRLIHPNKNFAELEDCDIQDFLRKRSFGSENLNIEFKREFPQKPGGQRYEIRDICKYIVGLSNEEGGLVIYGVSDDIKNPQVAYPNYLVGLHSHPSLEDLSQWVKDRVHPLIASPSIKLFSPEGLKVAILKIPAGVNKPYCYCDTGTNAVTFFKKTSGGIAELRPGEIREFHRTQMLDQAVSLLQAAGSQAVVPIAAEGQGSEKLKQHKQAVASKLEDVTGFGLVQIYCLPLAQVEIPIDYLKEFLETHRFKFSEIMRHFPQVEVFQNGVSVGFFPRAIRQDIKSTARITLYRDGLIAFDSLADTFMDGDRDLNPFWLSYELQRQIQLAQAVLAKFSVERIRVIVDFEDIQDFRMTVESPRGKTSSEYAGHHEAVSREVELSEVHDFDGARRDMAMPVVQDIMDEVSRIFGFSKAWPGLWDSTGKLAYVKGVEDLR